MARYRTVDVRIWGDRKFRTLSPPQPNAQTLWIYLLTGEHTGPLPGLSRVGEHGLAEQLRWSLKALRRCWDEIAGQDMAAADWDSRVVWVKNRINYAEPENPNVIKSWRAAWDEIPECALKAEAWGVFYDYMVERDRKARARAKAKEQADPGMVFTETFLGACPNPSGNPSAKGLTKGFGKGLANQDQDQDQEQEISYPQPPSVPEGGSHLEKVKRITRAERKRATDYRSRVMGGCRHEPRCPSVDACIEAIVLGWREAATAPPTASPPTDDEVTEADLEMASAGGRGA
jgi:hypothetical protein